MTEKRVFARGSNSYVTDTEPKKILKITWAEYEELPDINEIIHDFDPEDVEIGMKCKVYNDFRHIYVLEEYSEKFKEELERIQKKYNKEVDFYAFVGKKIKIIDEVK